ncbi:MAG: hypothetical protein N4A72_00010 [Bacteroidales bacterium]|nr:hypothetical protein [Bacteroidales bacterium]
MIDLYFDKSLYSERDRFMVVFCTIITLSVFKETSSSALRDYYVSFFNTYIYEGMISGL